MTAQELVARAQNLPPVSVTALKLVNLLEQPAVSNDDIVQVLKCDNILTGKLLRACNSPYFALEEPVSSVDQAVFLLGHQQILHIVLTLAFGSTMVVPLAAYASEAEELWHHSLITAIAAEVVSNEISDLNADVSVAFTAGLLHDIGKLVLCQALPPETQHELHQRIEEKTVSRAQAENELFGTNHSEVGACLLQNWHLPEEIVESVANHHQPVLKPRPRLSVATHLANCIAHCASSDPGWDPCASQLNDGVSELFNIAPEKLDTMVAMVRDSFDRVEQFVNMG